MISLILQKRLNSTAPPSPSILNSPPSLLANSSACAAWTAFTKWREREGGGRRGRMMKRTLTASPKVLPFTFRSAMPRSLQKTKFRLELAFSFTWMELALFKTCELPERTRTPATGMAPSPTAHPVVISLSQAGFLRGSEFQFSPSTPFPPLPSFPPSFKEFECNLGLLPLSRARSLSHSLPRWFPNFLRMRPRTMGT